MKRLITGAIVALVLFCAPARADDTFNTRVLKITVYATSPKRPLYEALRVWLPFDTRFTCEESQELLDTQLIMKAVQDKKHIKVLRASVECVEAGADIQVPSRISWVVETPSGYLGKRRHEWSEGRGANASAAFKFARVFAREVDAHKATEPGDKVVPVTITTTQVRND